MYNIKVSFAHGVSHAFINVDYIFASEFRKWMYSKDEASKIMMFERKGTQYYMNRDYICALTIEEVK